MHSGHSLLYRLEEIIAHGGEASADDEEFRSKMFSKSQDAHAEVPKGRCKNLFRSWIPSPGLRRPPSGHHFSPHREVSSPLLMASMAILGDVSRPRGKASRLPLLPQLHKGPSGARAICPDFVGA